MIAMAVTVIVGITSRGVFNHPLHFVDEYNGYFNVAIILLPLAYVLRRAGHLRLDIVVRALPQRAAKYLQIATDIVAAVVIIVLTIGVSQMVAYSFATSERAWSFTGTPLGPVQLVMPIGLGLFAIQIVIDIVKRIKGEGIHQISTISE